MLVARSGLGSARRVANPRTVKPKDLLLLLALLAVGAATTTLLFVGGGEDPVAEEPSPAPVDPPPEAIGSVEPRESQVEPVQVGNPRQDPERRVDTSGATPSAGRFEISIVLTAGMPAFGGYTIHLEEAINPNAAKELVKREPVRRTEGRKNDDPGRSPIYASISDVPYSEYGYRVWVFVPGLNGSDAFVRCDASSPYADVTLQLTPPAPFHLRLIDQYRNPIVAKTIVLRPVGWPPGRGLAEKTTDSFGVAIYDGLLAGGWELWFDDAVRGELVVESPGIVRDDANLGVASRVLTVPLGRSLRVETFDAANFGLQDVDLVLSAIDTTERRRFEAKTDATGSWTFHNVTPGRWQLHASGRGHQTRDVAVTIEPDKDPAPLQVWLVRLR